MRRLFQKHRNVTLDPKFSKCWGQKFTPTQINAKKPMQRFTTHFGRSGAAAVFALH